ncbi:hypothetical protein DFAR_3440003 [Desulfarculales bacterium]
MCLLLIVTATRFLLWLTGLPVYYRQYSTLTMVIFDILVLPPIWLAVYFSVKRARSGRALAVAWYLGPSIFRCRCSSMTCFIAGST